MVKKVSELTVITKAKDLCNYVMIITQKSPKHFRYTFITRLQNLSLDIVECLYRANDTFVTKENTIARQQRLEYQHRAMTSLRLLAFFSEISCSNNCILPKQYEQIAMKTTECLNYLGAWINSDRKRLSS